jgi:molybdate transport repressor ModE-like protein
MELNTNDTIKNIITKTLKHEHPIEIHLKSNKSFTGRVISVGQHCISLKQSGDRSFYDVMINISDISAVEIRDSGSIQKAAVNLGLDFKKAHEMLTDLQDAFTTDKLFTTERGRTGGTNITLLTRSLIDTYNLLNSIFEAVKTQINECLIDEEIELLDCLMEKNLQ